MTGSDYQESMLKQARAESESDYERSENEENGTVSNNDELIGVSVKSKEQLMACTYPNKDPNDQYVKPKY